MPITKYLSFNAEKYSFDEAIVMMDSNYSRAYLTWKEVEDLSNRIANMMISKSIKKGDKIGLLLLNSLLWLPIYFGILKSGAIAVLLNYNNSIDEISYCIEHVACRGVFLSASDKCYNVLCSKEKLFLFEVHDDISVFKKQLLKYSNENGFDIISDNDEAVIHFSSGTTGRSKAILSSHAALLSAAEIELYHHYQKHEDRFICLTPLYHAGTTVHWFGSLLVGGAMVMFSSRSPVSIINVIERERISIAWLLVPQIQDILNAIEMGDINVRGLDIKNWRLMHSGAQPIPASLINRWHDLFPWQFYDTNYGLTETTGPGCIHLGMENIHKAGAIGKPDQRWQVDIVDDSGTSVDSGTVGELILKGPGLMMEYYKDEQATKETIKNGWLYSGDMAYMDHDGFIYLVDRKKDIIISGGENIYPIQIESHIRQLQCIKDVAVVGVSNYRMGELVAAIIEIKEEDSCSKKKVIDHCRILPSYMRPVKIIFAPVIRNSTGKVDKKEIKKTYFC